MGIMFCLCTQCAICMSAKATMQTLPCGHRVVCRKCFIRTIQSAIADHSLPLKCIVCRASVLKLGQCKVDQASSSSSSSVTGSRPSRRPVSSSVAPPRTPHQAKATTTIYASAASRASQTAGPGITEHHPAASRANDVTRPPPEVSSTTTRSCESSSQRASHQRGCCHHHHIPLRQLQSAGQQDVSANTGIGASKITKLQPLPIYPAQGSAPTQRRAFSTYSAAAAVREATSSTSADSKDCATSSALRPALVGHRA